jgi:hypothetical protein
MFLSTTRFDLDRAGIRATMLSVSPGFERSGDFVGIIGKCTINKDCGGRHVPQSNQV